MLNEKGIIVCEYDNTINTNYDSLEVIKEKKYGDKFVLIFKNKLWFIIYFFIYRGINDINGEYYN